MSDAEFWDSTVAKVLKLYETKIIEPAKRSDYFVALIISNLVSSDKKITPDDILSIKYHIKKDVIITHDPELGAQGNWRALRASLKGKR
jgi:hypothetical protein